MRGITEKRLREIYLNLPDTISEFNSGKHEAFEQLLEECIELNPRIPLDEFLKSHPNDCWCWMHTATYVDMSYFSNGEFRWDDRADAEVFQLSEITHVTPLQEPETPE